MDKGDLQEFIADNLHEMSWRHKYSLDDNIAVASYIAGLQKAGFAVMLGSDPFQVFYVYKHADKHYELSAKISFEEILCGWNRTPRASPSALYNSIYLIYDRLEENILKQYENSWDAPRELRNDLFTHRSDICKKAREHMEENFLDYFRKYQEGILKPCDIDLDNPYQSKILNSLIEKDAINFNRINAALIRDKDKQSGASSAYSIIASLKDGEPLEHDYLIWKGHVEDYIWGVYLIELAKVKGYSLKNYSFDEEDYDNLLEVAVDQGWHIFKRKILKK